MKHWTGLYTHGAVLAVASVTELGGGRLNVVVTSNTGKARWEPGKWAVTEAQKLAETWAEEMLGGRKIVDGVATMPGVFSGWLEGEVEP
jgi:hypothetical protein